MADVGIEQLKEDIQADIKANNNQTITGDLLQERLIDTVDTLKGYTDDHVSVSQNSQTGHTDITIGDTTTPVASVEEVSQLGQETQKDLDKVIKLVGISGVDIQTVGLNEYFFSDYSHKIFERIAISTPAQASDFREVPFYDGAIYTYNNELYTWNGNELTKDKEFSQLEQEVKTLFGDGSYEEYGAYLKNVYIIPKTQEKFEYIQNQTIKITYLGVRDENLGGSNSIFGLQLRINNNNVCSFWTTEIPSLYQNQIIKLPFANGNGEIAQGFDIYVNFNNSIDFETPSGLIRLNYTYVHPLTVIQIPILLSLFNLQQSVEKLNGEASFYQIKELADYSILKDWFLNNISQIFYIDNNYTNNREYKVLYLTTNNTVLGGQNYLGFQIGIYEDGNLIHQYNYLIQANNLDSNTLYKVSGEGNCPSLYIRTSSTYSWLNTDIQASGNPLFILLSAAIGQRVLPFAKEAANNAVVVAIDESLKQIKRTHTIHQWGNLTQQEYELFDNFYVCGNYDIPGKILVIVYVGFNSSNLGGENAFGLQLALKDSLSGTITQRTNFFLHNANSVLEAGRLYTFDSQEQTDLGKKVKIYFKTNNNFTWPSYDALRTCEIYIENYGGFGENIRPFINALRSEFVKKSDIITVGKDASKFDYTSLTAATNQCPNNSIILVYPGIYENECILAGITKTLYIIGIDRDKCVIKNNLGDYEYAVIHISSGLLRNLTIIQEATTTTNTGAYGVHIDFNTGYNSTLRIENCHLQSNVPNTGGAGIGLRGGMHLTFKGCRLVSGTSGRALYLHDNDQDSYVGLQNFTMEDCILESPNQAILIQGQGKVGRDFSVQQFYIEFCRNIIKGTVNFTNWYSGEILGPISADDFQGVKNLRLVDTSWGNSASVLNANLD